MGDPQMNSSPANADVPLLAVTGVQGTTGSFTIGPITMEVHRGHHLGIIGLSGSGKTSLLRILALFKRPHRGVIRTPTLSFDFDTGYQPHDQNVLSYRRFIGYVSQQNTLWPHLTIEENVQLGLKHVRRLDERECHKRMRSLFESLELVHVARRRTWEVSGGEARRAAVARAVAMEPQVLLLDEPDAGLDPLRSQQQMELILSICNDNRATAVVVSHNPAVIGQTAQHVLVMDNGQLLAPDTCEPDSRPFDRMLIRAQPSAV
jgi:ABC-type transporter Mla maintaining outer membrane lipid asymmetry ATPase subunit MlaF